MPNMMDKKASTLIESVTVVAVLGILTAVFYAVFVTNWITLEDRMALASIQEEADQSLERMTMDIRGARQIDLLEDGNSRSINILDSDSHLIAVYQMNDSRILQVSKDGENFSVLSPHLDYTNSGFSKLGKALAVKLALSDQVFLREVRVNVSTEIYPRN